MSAQYVELEPGKWIKTENTKAEVLFTSLLQIELSNINERLAEIPADVSDEELLAWAKLNYPEMSYARERESLTSRRDIIEVDLASMGE